MPNCQIHQNPVLRVVRSVLGLPKGQPANEPSPAEPFRLVGPAPERRGSYRSGVSSGRPERDFGSGDRNGDGGPDGLEPAAPACDCDPGPEPAAPACDCDPGPRQRLRVLARTLAACLVAGTVGSGLGVASETPAGTGATTAGTSSYVVDNISPTLAISKPSHGALIRAGTEFTVEVIFSEEVFGFTEDDLIVTNGTVVAGSLQKTDRDLVWTFVAIPTRVGRLMWIWLQAGIVTDAAGNENRFAPAWYEDVVQPSTAVILSVEPGAASEAGSSYRTIRVVAEFDKAAELQDTNFVVTVGGPDDSATKDRDYVSSNYEFSMTIPRLEEKATVEWSVAFNDDKIAEGDEVITLHSPAGAGDLSVRATTLVIEDNDETSTEATLWISPRSVAENDTEATAVRVLAQLNNGAFLEAREVSVLVGASGDSALSGTDYQPVEGFTLTIPAEQDRGSAEFFLAPIDDEFEEGAETITVTGTASGLSMKDGTLTLTDDEQKPTSVSLSLSPDSVSENGGERQIEVTADLDRAAAAGRGVTAVNVTVGRAGDSAVSATDYKYVTDFVLTIPEGRTTGTATFTLTPRDDGAAEGPEEITVHGTASGLPTAEATLTLNDDDPASTSVSLSVAPASVLEDGGARQIQVTAELDGAAGVEPTSVDVTVGRPGDSAVSGTDYAAVADFVLTIPARQTTGTTTFTLTPDDDAIAEGPEEITVSGTASGLTLKDATLTLNDNERAATSVTVSVDQTSVWEDAGSVSLELTAVLDGGLAPSAPHTMLVNVGISSDSAVSGKDYNPVSQIRWEIPRGKTTATTTFTLTLVDNEVAEGPRTITLDGISTIAHTNDAVLTILDDDTAATLVYLSTTPVRVAEDGGPPQIEVLAELNGAAGREPVAVNVTVGRAGDSAVSGTDYGAVADFVLTIPAGQTTDRATFTLTPKDDQVAEGLETITVHGTASGLTVDEATILLNDDDQASTSVSLSVDPPSLSEGGGARLIALTAAVDRGARQEPTVVTVTVGRTGDSATSGTDYLPIADFALTIPARQTTGTATFILAPDDDEVAEGVEEITVHGTTSGLTVDDATLTLNDDDAASTAVSLSVDPASVSEDAGAVSVEVTGELEGAAGLEPTAVNVTVGRTGDSAIAGTDYPSVADFVLTIPALQTTGTATFTLTPADDEIAEGVEEITVHGTASGLTVDDATLALNDDDAASTSVSLSVAPASVMEDAGSVLLEVTAELGGNPGTEPTSVGVTVGRAEDSAVSGTDYTSVADFLLIIPALQTTGTATFTLTLGDDEVAEGVEEITVHGTASGLTVDDATITLNDDDTASTSASLSLSPASVSEAAGAVSVEVTAELDGAAGLEPTAVSVAVGRAGDSAVSGEDYTSVAGFVLTIPALQTTGTATFTLAPVNDEVKEGAEAITVHGTGSDLTVADATLTLNDDEIASTSVLLSLSPASVSEDAGSVSVQVTAELDGAAGLEPTPVNVTVGRTGDSATSGTDYEPVVGFALTIPARERTVTGTFTVTPADDRIAEGPETITVHGTASGLTVDDTILTLNDDDPASVSVSLSVDPASVSEDAGSVSVQVTAELDAAAGPEPTAVNVTVGRTGDSAASGTDYTSVADFVLTIPGEQTTGTATFTLAPDDDEVAEGVKEITVHGTASGLTVDDATLTLNDDDQASTSVSLSVDPASVSEDAGSVSVQVTAELDAAAGPEPTAVNVTVGGAGDSAVSGTDYASVAGFVLTIPGEQTTGTATFTLALDDDEVAEGAEEITVHGTASGLTVDDTALTLNDDDQASASVSLSVDPASVSEDAGSVSVQVTAELDAAAGPEPTAVNVTVGRSGDSAASGTDYPSVADFVLTIPGEQTTGTATFTLALDDDEVAEGVEEITVHGTASGLTVDDATLTLNDDDQASTSVSLSVSPAAVPEDGGARQIEVTAALDGAAGPEPTAVNVTVGRAGDSAVSGADYASVAGFVLTIPARQTTGTATFTLTPDDDEVAEGVEEITVRGTASGLTVDDAALTLNDDDQASTSVSLSLDPASVSEDAASVWMQVTAELDGGAGLEPTAVNVTVGRSGDSAASGTDYTPVADFVLTIPARQTTGTATFTLALDDDEVAEGVGGDHGARDRERPHRGRHDPHPERRRHGVRVGVPLAESGRGAGGRRRTADRGDGGAGPRGTIRGDERDGFGWTLRGFGGVRDGLRGRGRLCADDPGDGTDRDRDLHVDAGGRPDRGGSGDHHRARERERAERGGDDAHSERRRRGVRIDVPVAESGFRLGGRRCAADRGDGGAGRRGTTRGDERDGFGWTLRGFGGVRDGLRGRGRLCADDPGDGTDRDRDLHVDADGRPDRGGSGDHHRARERERADRGGGDAYSERRRHGVHVREAVSGSDFRVGGHESGFGRGGGATERRVPPGGDRSKCHRGTHQ